MMMKYELTSSDIDWIGEVPKHWEVKKLKRLLSEKLKYGATESGDLDNPDDPRYIRITDFDDNGFLRDDTFKSLPPEVAKDYLLTEGDVLFARSGATVGKTFIFKDYKGIACFAGYLIKATTLKYRLLPEFLFYYTKSNAYEDWKNIIFTQATIQNIGADKYQYLNVPVPKIPEQIAIANFLDKACADLDRVLEIKHKQIENLQEQLKSQISNWFTRGTQLELKKTDSLIIPEIPLHWQLLKLKRVLEDKLKYGANESGDLDNPDDPRYIRITDFDDDGSLRDDTFKSLPPEVAKEYLLSEGDVLFARSGATVGKTFIFKNYKGTACYAGYLIKAVTLKHKVLPDYLYYYTKTKMYEDWKNIIFTQATIQNIGADKYQYLPVPVPPIDEQKEILIKTELLNERIKKAQSVIERQIDILVNYKKSLIHEVVTGKKQVSGLSSTGQNEKPPTQTDE